MFFADHLLGEHLQFMDSFENGPIISCLYVCMYVCRTDFTAFHFYGYPTRSPFHKYNSGGTSVSRIHTEKPTTCEHKIKTPGNQLQNFRIKSLKLWKLMRDFDNL